MALERVDDVQELRLRSGKVLALLSPDGGGCLEVGLILGERGRELIDLTVELVDRGGGALDRRFELLHFRLAGLDLVTHVLRPVFTPFGVFRVHPLGLFALLDDLGLQAREHRDHLCHGIGVGRRAGGGEHEEHGNRLHHSRRYVWLT